MRSRNSLRIGILLTSGILVLIAGSLITATTQEKPPYKTTGTEATIVGTISFDGTPPKPLRIDTSADPVCETTNPDQTTDWVVVSDHKLANVVVYVRGESLNLYSFETPSAGVTLEHKGCRYVPHVLGLQTQQTLWVLNSDATTHNTHPTPKNNRDGTIHSRQEQLPLRNGLSGRNFSSHSRTISILGRRLTWVSFHIHSFLLARRTVHTKFLACRPVNIRSWHGMKDSANKPGMCFWQVANKRHWTL